MEQRFADSEQYRCTGSKRGKFNFVPFYLDNGQLMLQPSNTPNGNSEFSAISAKYEVPILFYNHCDYVYREQDSEEEKIKKVDTLVDDYGYNFVQENQLAKMTAAAYNSRVSAKWDNDTLYLSAAAKNEDIPLYDKNYQNSTGVKGFCRRCYG